MITNVGKNILAKYLVGQAPAYASHIAIGCGAKPRSQDYELVSQDFSQTLNKERLDFEMLRAPIVSRGYVNDGGLSKIVLTAELPTIERYEITEVGVFSSGFNPTAGAYDSKPIYTFAETENWEYHTDSFAIDIPRVSELLGTSEEPDIINQASLVFETNADNKTLLNASRINRYESCRYLNNTILMAGNSSEIYYSNDKMILADGSSHIHLTGANVDLNKNSPNDEIRFAFSIVNKDANYQGVPGGAKILIEFASSDSSSPSEYAQFQVDIENGTSSGQYDLQNNRYIVVNKQLQSLVKSPTFTWNSVTVVKIFASVLDPLGEPTGDYYIALDAIRLENIDSKNPLYGMTGYSVIKSRDALPIVKFSNTANLVEFRFALDVNFGT
jgi:hypothetical protein